MKRGRTVAAPSRRAMRRAGGLAALLLGTFLLCRTEARETADPCPVAAAAARGDDALGWTDGWRWRRSPHAALPPLILLVRRSGP